MGKTFSGPFVVKHRLADGTMLDSLDGFVIDSSKPENRAVFDSLAGLAERVAERRKAEKEASNVA